MSSVRITLNNPLPSSGSSPIDRIEYRLDQNDATITDAVITVPNDFVIPDSDASTRDIEIGQWNQTQFSGWSPVKTYQPSAPTAPQNLAIVAGNAQNSWSWDAPASNGGSAVTGYKLETNVALAGWTTIEASLDALTYTDSPLTNGVAVQCRVSANNVSGTGPASSIQTGTPIAPAGAVPVISAESWDNDTKTVTFTTSLACTCYIATGDVAQTPNAAGGWTSTPNEFFERTVADTTSFSVTLTDETISKLTYYLRNSQGNSVRVITVDVSFAASVGTMELEGNFLQSDAMDTASDVETTTGAFATPGKYLVGMTEICNAYNVFTLTGSNITGSATQLGVWATGSPDTNVRVYEVDTTAASTLVVTYNSGGDSFKRGLHIVKITDLTTTGNILGTAGASQHPTENGSFVTLSAVPVGWWVFSIAVSRKTNSSGAVWGGSFVSTDKVGDFTLEAPNRTTAALKQAVSTDDFACEPVFTGADLTGEKSTLAIAVGPA